MHSKRHVSRRQDGFGLLELMITVAIIGIIAAIAYPSYQSQVERSRRTDATTALLALAQVQERIMATCGEYATASMTKETDCGDVGGGIGLGADAVSEGGFYSLVVAGDADSYKLTATAQGAQVNDEDCQTFELTELGIKSGGVRIDPNTLVDNDCW
ncbi:type IV pilin protein [Cobetia sp. L2A1]|uniref:type IV pilin protein n=1 Tax=Cobetia sp. L2A1 TaxID=2686360 RepID=UPI00131B279D|nr:type IV pilin protein [Cobetia sp. L2A1]